MGRISQAYTYKHFLFSFQATLSQQENLIASTLCLLNFTKGVKIRIPWYFWILFSLTQLVVVIASSQLCRSCVNERKKRANNKPSAAPLRRNSGCHYLLHLKNLPTTPSKREKSRIRRWRLAPERDAGFRLRSQPSSNIWCRNDWIFARCNFIQGRLFLPLPLSLSLTLALPRTPFQPSAFFLLFALSFSFWRNTRSMRACELNLYKTDLALTQFRTRAKTIWPLLCPSPHRRQNKIHRQLTIKHNLLHFLAKWIYRNF